jgi:hypothetical protein
MKNSRHTVLLAVSESLTFEINPLITPNIVVQTLVRN